MKNLANGRDILEMIMTNMVSISYIQCSVVLFGRLYCISLSLLGGVAGTKERIKGVIYNKRRE